MNEQISSSTTQLHRPTTQDRTAWCTYWQTIGQEWRTEPEIDEKRQIYLEKCRSIIPNINQNIYPFKGVKLSRADVEWMLATHENGLGPINWVDRLQRNRQGLDLRGADLRQVDLSCLPLACMRGGLTSEEWQTATIEQYSEARMHLEKAYLSKTRLEGATLYGVHLDQANLRGAHLEKADLSWSHLERSILSTAHLEGADLRGAYFDTATNLEKVLLGDEQHGFVLLLDVHWSGVNLSGVDWAQMKMLGDERKARQKKKLDGKVKDKSMRLDEYEKAIRANRQLAVVLQTQGLDEIASHFIYRSQILRRWLLWQRRKFGRYLFSLFLDVLAGYGYKPVRSLIAYLIVLLGFAIAYYSLGLTIGPHLTPIGALIFSISSFHGRGFFPGSSPGGSIALDDPMAGLAALEAIAGLLIEISFIATFTQRFFGK